MRIRQRMRRAWLILPLLAGGMACQTTGTPSGDEAKRSLTMVVNASPTAAFWDDDPAPDGVRLHVSFYSTRSSQAVSADGMLEVGLWPGDLTRPGPAPGRPLHFWRFPPSRLAAHEHPSPVGPAYSFKLDWADDVPAEDVVTLVLHFQPRGPDAQDPPVIRRVVRVPHPQPPPDR